MKLLKIIIMEEKKKNIIILNKKELILEALKKKCSLIDIKSYILLYKEKDNEEKQENPNLYKNYFVFFGPELYKKTTHLSNILLFSFAPSIKKSSIDISQMSRYSLYKYFLDKKIEVDFDKSTYDTYSQLPFSLCKCPIPNILKNNLIKIYISDSLSGDNVKYFIQEYIKYINKI